MKSYEELKAFVQVVSKIDGVDCAVAEIYHIRKENLITEKQEEELYQLVDPEETVEIPAKAYDEGAKCGLIFNLANETITLVEAMKGLVD